MIHLLIFVLTLPPKPATDLAAWITGADRRALRRVARRESRMRYVAVHRIDAWASYAVCTKARRVGMVHSGADCKSGWWSTVGPHGLMSGYHLHWLGLDRWPWLFTIPVVSAFAAARKWQAQCSRGRRAAFGWCP